MVYQINMIVGGGNYENLRYKLYSIFDWYKRMFDLIQKKHYTLNKTYFYLPESLHMLLDHV